MTSQMEWRIAMPCFCSINVAGSTESMNLFIEWCNIVSLCLTVFEMNSKPTCFWCQDFCYILLRKHSIFPSVWINRYWNLRKCYLLHCYTTEAVWNSMLKYHFFNFVKMRQKSHNTKQHTLFNIDNNQHFHKSAGMFTYRPTFQNVHGVLRARWLS